MQQDGEDDKPESAGSVTTSGCDHTVAGPKTCVGQFCIRGTAARFLCLDSSSVVFSEP